jgi:hypothetical protein
VLASRHQLRGEAEFSECLASLTTLESFAILSNAERELYVYKSAIFTRVPLWLNARICVRPQQTGEITISTTSTSINRAPHLLIARQNAAKPRFVLILFVGSSYTCPMNGEESLWRLIRALIPSWHVYSPESHSSLKQISSQDSSRNDN